jgi:hypothetical protein
MISRCAPLLYILFASVVCVCAEANAVVVVRAAAERWLQDQDRPDLAQLFEVLQADDALTKHRHVLMQVRSWEHAVQEVFTSCESSGERESRLGCSCRTLTSQSVAQLVCLVQLLQPQQLAVGVRVACCDCINQHARASATTMSLFVATTTCPSYTS